MTKKKKAVFNPALKGLFENTKRDTNTTSKQIAEALGVSQQTVTSMSGKLDEVSVKDMYIIAKTMGVSPVDFLNAIIESSINGSLNSL